MLFADGSAIPLRLHGVRRFVPPGGSPWVEAHYDFLGLQSQWMNRAGQLRENRSIYATERSGYLQLNLYQLASTFTTRYTTASIRDAVVTAFHEGSLIRVYDLDDVSQPQEGWLVSDGLKEHVQDTGYLSGIIQHILQISMRYMELYTRAVV